MGNYVAISSYGNNVAVGSPCNDGNGINSGNSQVYSQIVCSWVKVGDDFDWVSTVDN